MPKYDFTDEERRALADVAREYVRNQRYPLASRLAAIEAQSTPTAAQPPEGAERIALVIPTPRMSTTLGTEGVVYLS